MKRFAVATLSIVLTLSFSNGPAWADMAEWQDSGKYGGEEGEEEDGEEGEGEDGDGEAGDGGTGESGDEDEDEDEVGEQYEAPDHGEPDEGCMAAAVNPTTSLSLGLGIALLLGLRRSDRSA